MIRNEDVIERLGLLIGKELTNEDLHEALFCEEKHKKIRSRFGFGKQTYLHYKVTLQPEIQAYADISILGNPNTFRIGVEEKDGKVMIISNPRISYTYL